MSSRLWFCLICSLFAFWVEIHSMWQYLFLNVFSPDIQTFDTIQDAISRRLYDDDLSVVKAVLNVEALSEIVNPSFLLDAVQNVLQRCIGLLTSSEFDFCLNVFSIVFSLQTFSQTYAICSWSYWHIGSEHESSLAVDVAVSCLQHAVISCHEIDSYVKKFATLLFPLILIVPKVYSKIIFYYYLVNIDRRSCRTCSLFFIFYFFP